MSVRGSGTDVVCFMWRRLASFYCSPLNVIVSRLASTQMLPHIQDRLLDTIRRRIDDHSGLKLGNNRRVSDYV
jgi:hypothetical protein